MNPASRNDGSALAAYANVTSYTLVSITAEGRKQLGRQPCQVSFDLFLIAFYKHVENTFGLFFPHIFDYLIPTLNDYLINWFGRADRFSQLALHPITEIAGIDAALKRSENHPSKLMGGCNHLLITRGIETTRPRFEP